MSIFLFFCKYRPTKPAQTMWGGCELEKNKLVQNASFVGQTSSFVVTDFAGRTYMHV